MHREFKLAFTLFREELKKAVIKNLEEVVIWRRYIGDIPFCELKIISGEEILSGSLFKGRINFWRLYSELDYYVAEDEEDEENYLDPNREIRAQLTAKFYFKENNKAVLEYPPNEKLPRFKGTWNEVLLEIVDLVKRKSCGEPALVKSLANQIDFFNFSQEN